MTVNQYLPAAYIETVWRLAAGIDPVSALGGGRAAARRPGRARAGPQAAPGAGRRRGDRQLPGGHRPAGRRPATAAAASRSPTRCPGSASPVAVRLYDTGRRYVPRRLRLPVPAEAAVVAQEQAAESSPVAADPEPGVPPGAVSRARTAARRPAPPPSAAGCSAPTAAPPAGRASRPPTPTTATPVGWAHGDDRGEFLLVLTSSDAGLFTPGSALARSRSPISARPVPATIDSPAESQADPLWDLEVETLPPPGSRRHRVRRAHAAGRTTAGRSRPPLSFVKGAVSRPRPPFVIP